jgi:hypothetical protein
MWESSWKSRSTEFQHQDLSHKMADKPQSSIHTSMASKPSQSLFTRLLPQKKVDNRPEWERKRDEKFKQWEKDK